jgi:hypothetical protein
MAREGRQAHAAVMIREDQEGLEGVGTQACNRRTDGKYRAMRPHRPSTFVKRAGWTSLNRFALPSGTDRSQLRRHQSLDVPVALSPVHLLGRFVSTRELLYNRANDNVLELAGIGHGIGQWVDGAGAVVWGWEDGRGSEMD